MIDAVIWGAVPGLLVVLLTGLRRFRWRWRAVVGLGSGIVFWAVRIATLGADPAAGVFVEPVVLVLIGAAGGSLSQFGFDRGEEERRRRTAAFLAG